MKKFAKMSLVAALAVAGTTASAQPLAEAIKNVDVSGSVVYRYDDYNVDNGASNVDNYYKVGLTLKSKVTDDVTFNSRFLVAAANGGFVNVNQAVGAGLDTSDEGDANPGVSLSWANFAYTGITNTTVVVGKQGLATPWTKAIDSDGSEQTGTGILAMSTFGPVTAAAGYFNQTNITGGDNLMVGALIGNFGPVTAEAWYLDIDNNYNQYFVKASGSIDLDAVKLGMFAQYSDRDNDANNNDENLLKVGINAKAGIFNAALTYAKTGEDGAAIINAVSTNSAIGYSVNFAGESDTDGYFVDLGAQVTDKLHVGLNYDEFDNDNSNTEHKEAFVQLTYKHAKNLSAYVRYADGEDEGDVDYNRGRLQVEYKF